MGNRERMNGKEREKERKITGRKRERGEDEATAGKRRNKLARRISL